MRTPQFYILLIAYFGHVICLATTASFAMAHLTQRGVLPIVVGFVLTFEALAGMAWRLLAGVMGDLFDARYLLISALASVGRRDDRAERRARQYQPDASSPSAPASE